MRARVDPVTMTITAARPRSPTLCMTFPLDKCANETRVNEPREGAKQSERNFATRSGCPQWPRMTIQSVQRDLGVSGCPARLHGRSESDHRTANWAPSDHCDLASATTPDHSGRGAAALSSGDRHGGSVGAVGAGADGVGGADSAVVVLARCQCGDGDRTGGTVGGPGRRRRWWRRTALQKSVTGLPPLDPGVKVMVAWPAPPVVPVTVGAPGAVACDQHGGAVGAVGAGADGVGGPHPAVVVLPDREVGDDDRAGSSRSRSWRLRRRCSRTGR